MPTLTIYHGKIGKAFDVDSETGKLVKLSPRFPHLHHAETITFASLRDYAKFLDANAAKNFCFTHGLPKKDGAYVAVNTDATERSVRGELLGVMKDLPLLRRNHAELSYRPGHIFCNVDYDPMGHVLDEQGVWAQLVEAEPGLAGRAWIGYASTSAYIKIDDKFVSQRRGARILFNAILPRSAGGPDTNGPKAYMEIIHQRLVILGHYHIEIQNTGRLKLKTVVDLAVYRASQPDFAGAPLLESSRLSRERPPVVIGEGDEAPFDLLSVKPLTYAERRAYDDIEAREKVKHAEPMRERAEKYNAERDARELPGSGLTVEQLRARRRLNEQDVLPIETSIHIDNLGWVSGRDILADPSAYNNRTCASPVDPYYASTDGRPSKHKAKIHIKGGEVEIIDFAHGAFKVYRFVGENTLDRLLKDFTDLDTLPALAAGGSRLPEGVGLDINEPPMPAKPFVVPLVALSDVQATAIATLDHTGMVVATGLDMSIAVLLEQVGRHRFTIHVPDYDAAAATKEWLRKAFPGKSIMILPGRSVDAKQLRVDHGATVLDYPVDLGPIAKGTDGETDEICFKVDVINMLERAGRIAVAGATCIVRRGGDVIRCQDFHNCGFNKRVRAKGVADIVIRVNVSLKGDSNPLIEPDEQPPRVAVLDVFDRSLGEMLTWPKAVWDAQPELAGVLRVVEAGEPPNLPFGALEALDAWAGTDNIRPNMDKGSSLKLATEYAEESFAKVGRALPPLRAVDAVNAWRKGDAVIRIAGGTVKVFIENRLAGVEKAVDLIVAASPMRAMELPGRFHSGRGTAIMEANTRRQPKRVIQLTTQLGKLIAKRGDSKLANDAAAQGRLLDLTALLRWMHAEHGPGLALAPEEGLGKLLPELRAVDFHDANLVHMAALAPTFEATKFIVVVNHLYPSDDSLIRSAIDLPRASRPPCIESGEIFKQKVRARYRLTNGRGLVYGEEWRYAGADEPMDRLFCSMIAAPVLYFAEATARAEEVIGRVIPFFIVDSFPVHVEGMPRSGISVDELLPLESVLPRSAWLETTVRGLNTADAARSLDTSRRSVNQTLQQISEKEEAAKLERWLQWLKQ